MNLGVNEVWKYPKTKIKKKGKEFWRKTDLDVNFEVREHGFKGQTGIYFFKPRFQIF